MTYASTTTLNLIRDANPCEAELAPSLAAALLVAENALRPFSEMAGEMFAANWNDDEVAISFVTKDGPMRITFKEFREAHAARAALKEATATVNGIRTHREKRGRGDDLRQHDDT